MRFARTRLVKRPIEAADGKLVALDGHEHVAGERRDDAHSAAHCSTSLPLRDGALMSGANVRSGRSLRQAAIAFSMASASDAASITSSVEPHALPRLRISRQTVNVLTPRSLGFGLRGQHALRARGAHHCPTAKAAIRPSTSSATAASSRASCAYARRVKPGLVWPISRATVVIGTEASTSVEP